MPAPEWLRGLDRRPPGVGLLQKLLEGVHVRQLRLTDLAQAVVQTATREAQALRTPPPRGSSPILTLSSGA
jgi:hypothetical protein